MSGGVAAAVEGEASFNPVKELINAHDLSDITQPVGYQFEV